MEYKAPKTEITGSTTDTPQGHRYATLQKAGVVLVNILPGRFGINRWWQEKEHIIQSTKNDEEQWEQHSKNTPVNHKLILFSP